MVLDDVEAGKRELEVAEPVCAPVKRISELTLCETVPAQMPVVAGTVSRIVVAEDSEIVVTPPNNASNVWKLGLSAAVPQVPLKSPVFGAMRYFVLVTGSVIYQALAVGIGPPCVGGSDW